MRPVAGAGTAKTIGAGLRVAGLAEPAFHQARHEVARALVRPERGLAAIAHGSSGACHRGLRRLDYLPELLRHDAQLGKSLRSSLQGRGRAVDHCDGRRRAHDGAAFNLGFLMGSAMSSLPVQRAFAGIDVTTGNSRSRSVARVRLWPCGHYAALSIAAGRRQTFVARVERMAPTNVASSSYNPCNNLIRAH